ncbi:SH3 domain-containing protein [Sphingorhabdus arenilitoris]|uniref:SH3 domain-containing protein n=1 Tax=Sphingorhabdus arenilitoris TaxID=1490041 RepID=A0ABV8RHS1_9SPHN
MMKNNVKLSVYLAAFCAAAMSPLSAQSNNKLPYWASLDEPEARMRTGPSTEFPVKWVYKRKDLPLKVVDRHSVWRKVEDPDGDQGWMHVRLLSPTRTAIVIGSSNGALRDAPSPTARIAWRVEPGVVGRIDDCQKGWCRFDTSGRAGYIEAEQIYGDETP